MFKKQEETAEPGSNISVQTHGVPGDQDGEMWSAIVHKKHSFLEKHKNYTFQYSYASSRNQNIYYFNTPFIGKTCGDLTFVAEYTGDTIIAKQEQTSTCSDKTEQPFYITNQFADFSYYKTLKVQQFVDGKLIHEESFDVDSAKQTYEARKAQ